jgi:hypothetical protein
VADHLAPSLDATTPGTYRQRGTSSLQRLFRAHLPNLLGGYDVEFTARLGKYRLERIDPDGKSEYWRPFSSKVFHSVSFNGRGFAHQG